MASPTAHRGTKRRRSSRLVDAVVTTSPQTTKDELDAAPIASTRAMPAPEQGVFLSTGLSRVSIRRWEARDVFTSSLELIGVYNSESEARKAMAIALPAKLVKLSGSAVVGHVVKVPDRSDKTLVTDTWAAVKLLASSSGPVIGEFDTYGDALETCKKLHAERCETTNIGTLGQVFESLACEYEDEKHPVEKKGTKEFQEGFSRFDGSWVSRGAGKLLVGLQIRVLWPDDNRWYNAIIISFNETAKRHVVLYDADGAVEELDLRKENVELPNYPPGSRNGSLYTTVDDDSIAQLAKKFNVDLMEFAKLNAPLHPAIQSRLNSKKLKVVFQEGTRLFLPLTVDGRFPKDAK